MRTVIKTCIILAALFLAASCSGVLWRSGEATLTVQFAQPVPRALSDPPFEQLPVFSAVRVTVSGPGMQPVSYTLSGGATGFTASIPAGPDRVIEIYAPVDWDATDAVVNAAPGPAPIPLPRLVKAYGATASASLEAGKTTSVNLRLQVAETKILLPEYAGGANPTLRTISNLSSLVEFVVEGMVPIANVSDFAFDRYGRLLFTGMDAQVLACIPEYDPSLAVAVNEYSATDIAYYPGLNRLYTMNRGGSTDPLVYIDLNYESPTSSTISMPAGFALVLSCLAVDTDGYVYVAMNETSTATSGIAKLSIVDGPSVSATLEAFSSLASLHVDGLELRDFQVANGK